MLDACRAASADWDFCCKFRTPADRLDQGIVEAKAAKDQDEAEKVEKALKKLTEDFPAATGLASLPASEPELKKQFTETEKEPTAAFGQDSTSNLRLAVLDHGLSLPIDPAGNHEREERRLCVHGRHKTVKSAGFQASTPLRPNYLALHATSLSPSILPGDLRNARPGPGSEPGPPLTVLSGLQSPMAGGPPAGTQGGGHFASLSCPCPGLFSATPSGVVRPCSASAAGAAVARARRAAKGSVRGLVEARPRREEVVDILPPYEPLAAFPKADVEAHNRPVLNHPGNVFPRHAHHLGHEGQGQV